MSVDPARVRRAARQYVETCQLLGVDFVPRAARAPRAAAAATAGPAPAAPAAAAQAQAGPQPMEEGGSQGSRPATITTQATLGFDGLGGGGAGPEELPAQEKPAALEELRQRHDATCPLCTTSTYHTQTVFGEGHPDADLMFIGEAPGEQEDRTGRPFVGRAGKKLDEMIRAMGLAREDVYICNVLKSRPPENRTPLQPEVDQCSPFLAEQIRIIRPKVIVTLGGPATKLLLKTNVGITRLRGLWASYQDGALAVPVMPTFHPAYLLRNYTEDTRRKVWSDLQAVMSELGAGA